MDPVALLKGALPPIAAALLLVSWRGGRTLPVAAALGLYVAFGLLKDWLAWPHELWAAPNGTSWLVWGVAALALVAALEHARLLPARACGGLSAATGAAALWLVLDKLAQRWEPLEIALHVGGGGAIVAMSVLCVRGVLAHAPRSVAPVAWFALLLSLDAALVTLGKSALLGQLCGAVAAALGAGAGATVWRRGWSLAPADGAWIGGAHALFVLAGVQLGYLEWWPAGCALAALLPLWALRRAGGGRSWKWLLVATPASLLLMGAALWLALPEADPYGY